MKFPSGALEPEPTPARNASTESVWKEPTESVWKEWTGPARLEAPAERLPAPAVAQLER